MKEEQFSLFLVKVLYYTQALLLFNAIDTGTAAVIAFGVGVTAAAAEFSSFRRKPAIGL